MNRRVDLCKIMRDPVQRKDLIVESVIAAQAREGREVPREEVEATYDEMLAARKAKAHENHMRAIRLRGRGVL